MSDATMPFVAHLIELRDKLIKMLIVVLIIFLALFPFASEIYSIIAEPLISALPVEKNSQMIATGVISPFLTPLKMALILAIYLAMPYLLYQIWSFIAPGLYKQEKKLILPLVISSTILFYLGIVFAFFVVFPLAFDFLATIGPDAVNFAPDIANYLDFVLKVSFAFGVAFEVPIATILLIMFGATTKEKLQKNRPYIVIGAFVVGMLLTPPDVISQTLIAIPMLLLFEIGLLFAPMFVKRKQEASKNQNTDKEEEEDDFAEIDKQFAELDKEYKEDKS
jgi:sec-independent protein translocase protein TatC